MVGIELGTDADPGERPSGRGLWTADTSRRWPRSGEKNPYVEPTSLQSLLVIGSGPNQGPLIPTIGALRFREPVEP